MAKVVMAGWEVWVRSWVVVVVEEGSVEEASEDLEAIMGVIMGVTMEEDRVDLVAEEGSEEGLVDPVGADGDSSMHVFGLQRHLVDSLSVQASYWYITLCIES